MHKVPQQDNLQINLYGYCPDIQKCIFAAQIRQEFDTNYARNASIGF
jgi:hypothetical protein